MFQQSPWAPFIRILGRYGFGGLGVWGLLTPEQVTFFEMLTADPDVVLVVSMLGAAAVEAWYTWSKRVGGAT